MDQSSTLRNLVARREKAQSPRQTHILSVTSGKGGVGKSNFVLNVGIALSQKHKQVLIMDADMGLANIDILVGMALPQNLSHVLAGEATLESVIAEGPAGVHVLPAASGVEWMANLTHEQKLDFMQKMDALNGLYDIVLIDTGAGISSNVAYFNLAARTRIVIVTPEPTSLTDAYALIKVLHGSYHRNAFEMVVNGVANEKEGLAVYRNLTAVADRFLPEVRLGYLGHVCWDEHLKEAVLRQKAAIELHPDEEASRNYREIARRIAQLPSEATGEELGLFWRTMLEAPLA